MVQCFVRMSECVCGKGAIEDESGGGFEKEGLARLDKWKSCELRTVSKSGVTLVDPHLRRAHRVLTEVEFGHRLLMSS